MIELKGITKKFYQQGREITALRDVDLTVPQGKIFGVVGASGAGKSTLIRCVNLLERPTAGQVIVGGRDLTQLSAAALAKERKQIGMIFQHFNLLSSRTVAQNVAFPLELDGMPKNAVRQRVAELLGLVGLSEKADDYPASLSGGQKQRVAIARTLANNPKVLLCDEATSALDPGTTRSILQLLKRINQELHITMLLITHEMEVVKSICDNVAVISEGQLIEQGTVGEVFAHPETELARQFIASSLHVDIPAVYRQRLQPHDDGNGQPLLRLALTGKTVDEPVLSDAARRFNIGASIISAQMDHAGSISYGVMLVKLTGNRDAFADAIQYFKDKHIQVEIAGYV